MEKFEKSIKIDFSIYSNNCLYLIKDYVIVRGNKGLGLLYIKTKEYVQYIEGYNSNFRMCLDEYDNIYISEYNNNLGKLSIIKLKMIDGLFVKTKEYFANKNDIENAISFEPEIFEFEVLCMNKKDIITFMDEFIFTLKKLED